MKRCILFVLILCLLAALAACGRVEVSPSYDTGEVAATAPPLSQGAETDSVIAGSFMADTDGTLYSALPSSLPGVTCLSDILPQDAGYVYVFIPRDGTVYAVVRSDFMDLGSAQLCAFDTADGSCTVLADDCSGISKLILAGSTLYYEGSEGGIYSVGLDTDSCEEAIPDAVSLFGADGGFLYYTRDDGCVYRNDSKLDSEFCILSNYDSLYFFCSVGGLCNVSYSQENSGSLPVLEFRDESGNLKTRQVLGANVIGFCLQGDILYTVDPAENTLVGYSMADGTILCTTPFAAADELVTLLYVTDTQVFYTTLQDGTETVVSAELSSASAG